MDQNSSSSSSSSGTWWKWRRAAAVVVDDIVLCPRMQYHALSLASQDGAKVDVIFYGGTESPVALVENPSIYIHKKRQAPYQDSRRIPLLLRLLVKAIFQFFLLIWFIRFKLPIPDVFIVQHPPSAPALLVIKSTSWFRLTRLIIDWHDYMHKPFGLSSKRFSTAVRIYHWFERFLGRMADGALCVTQALKRDLYQNYGIEAEVFYDQTYDSFHPATIKEKHELFCRLREEFGFLYDIESWVNNRGDAGSFSGTMRRITTTAENCNEYDATDTLLTAQIDDGFRDKSDRPAIIATRMSWWSSWFQSLFVQYFFLSNIYEMGSQKVSNQQSKDLKCSANMKVIYCRPSGIEKKNLSMLLEAATIYDRHLDSTLSMEKAEQISLGADISTIEKHLYPKILFIIIVKGPEQQKYENIFRNSLLKHVTFFTLSLPSVDYQILLGSTDLGICLHTSSSGLNLPVTAADKFGCGLPVCAASFPGIEELIDDWKDGLVFSTSSDLAYSFLTLFRGFPNNCDALKLMRMGALAKASSARWHAEWENQVKPFIVEVVSSAKRRDMIQLFVIRPACLYLIKRLFFN